MKSTLPLILFILLGSVSAFAQQIRINTYGVYAFDDNVNYYYNPTNYYNGKVNGSFEWGIGPEYMIRQHTGLELLYMRQDTKVPLNYYSAGQQTTDFKLANNFIMAGGNQYFSKPQGKIEGYLGWLMGADIIDVKNPNNGYSGSTTKFSIGLKGGANIWLSPTVGIKLQAQVLSTLSSVGGGVYYGPGGGYGTVTASSMTQFGLGGGLVFKIDSHAR